MDNTTSNPMVIMIPIIFLWILISSIIIWSDPKKRNPLNIGKNKNLLTPWNISWIDALIFFFAIILFVFLVHAVVQSLIDFETIELTPKIALISILCLQIPILLCFIIFQKFYFKENQISLNSYSDAYKKRNKNTLTEHKLFQYFEFDHTRFLEDFKKSGVYFLQFLPLIWIVTLVWNFTLKILQKNSLIKEIPAQELVDFLNSSDINLSYFLLIAACGIILAPLVEEIIFRGCIYRFLKSKTTLLNAQIVTSILFAFAHFNLLSFVPIIFMGFILVRIYESNGSLWQSILFHAFFNASSFIFLGLAKYSGINIAFIFS